MEASRRQPGMLEGLSRFLVQHEPCGAGFDVAHPAGLGSGRVSITCRGCGARHEYATATIEVEREVRIEPAVGPPRTGPPIPPPPERAAPTAPPAEPRAPIPPRPAPYPDSTRPQAPSTPASGSTPAEATPPAATRPPVDPRTGVGAAAGSVQAPRTSGSALPTPPATGLPRPGGPSLRRPRPESALRRFWRSPRATLALLVIAAVALGIALVRLVNEHGGSSPQATQATPAGRLAPASPPTAPPAAAPTPAPGPKAPTPVPAPKPSSTTLRTQHFSIQLPQGWRERTSQGGLLVQPRGAGRVNVQVFFQRSPGLRSGQMSQQTASFLRHQVPGASLFPRQIRIAGQPAAELTARGPGETAIAVDLLRGPYRFLLVRRIFAGATPHASAAASRVVSSFSPG